MNKLIKIIIFLTGIFSLLFLNLVKAEEKIKIGLLIPMTGPNKNLGQSIIKAVKLALKDIDSDLIEIIPKDTSTKPNKTLQSAFELKEMGVKIFYIGKSLEDPKRATVMFQGQKNVLFDIFNNPETKPIVEASGHIYEGTIINRWISE